MKRFLNLVTPALLFCPVLFLTGCGSRNTAVNVERGVIRLEAGDYAAAARAFSRATRQIQDSAPLFYNLGTAYFQMNRYDAAVSACEAALRIDADFTDASELLAQIYIRQQNFEGAIRQLRPLLRQIANEARPRILNTLALAERGAGSPDLACLHLNQAMGLNPRYEPTYYNLGELLFTAFQLYPEAIDQFEMYVRRAPAEEPHVAKAHELLRKLKASGATAREAAAADRQPPRNAAQALRLIAEGDTLYKGRQWTRAESAYTQALAADPTSYEAAIRLGSARTAAGNATEAIKAYQRAGEIAPTRFEPVYLQAYAAYSGRLLDQAEHVLTTLAMPRWPTQTATYELMAYIRAAQKRNEEARIYGEHYLTLAPTSAPGIPQFRTWLDTLPVN